MAARHEKYYFEDENAIFRVENKLFKVYRRALMGCESSAFASMFSLPHSQEVEGQTDEKPIVLEGERIEEFEALMRVLYPPLLDNVLDIPIATYVRAMRMAVKYSMDDVQVAITKVIQCIPVGEGVTKAIALLAFVAEFPTYFSGPFPIQAFMKACSINYRPTADDLRPLLPYPNFLALMMQYREGYRDRNNAPWRSANLNYDVDWEGLAPAARFAGEGPWLVEEFKLLGFNL